MSYARAALAGLLALAPLVVAGCRAPGDQAQAATASRPAPAADCTATRADSGRTPAVVNAAIAFADSLSPSQRAALFQTLTLENAIRWSNLPARPGTRAGVPFGDLDAGQTAKAKALLLAAAGPCGATLFDENRAADVIGGRFISGVGPDNHYISFNGEPSQTRPWMLMAGGHHMAFNFVFNGAEPGATPLFAGSDPGEFTDAAGVARQPMARQSAALSALAHAVGGYPEARLPGVFTNLTRSVAFGFGRGRGGDSNYPHAYPTGETGRGVSYAKLPPAAQALVRRAIESYTSIPGAGISDPLLALYQAPQALAQTYVAVSGDPDLEDPNAYIRIDGPRVWIELSVQDSLIDRDKTHFHSIWRDKLADYGAQFRS